jgi:hypothetical protein
MITKKMFEDEIISGMQGELRKQASNDATPNLVKAADCLHAALEIFEEVGLASRADDVLKLLQKIAQHHTTKSKPAVQMPSINKLMELGMTQRDLMEFSKGNPIAKAKFNLILRGMGYSEHQIGKLLGPANVMSEQDARLISDPNRSISKMWEWMKDPEMPIDPNKVKPGESIKFKSIADDRHTRGLTSEKQVQNLKNHGTQFNLADINQSNKLNKSEVDPELADLLDADSFDINASDDELFGMDIKDDSLEVFDQEETLSDFEDERS